MSGPLIKPAWYTKYALLILVSSLLVSASPDNPAAKTYRFPTKEQVVAFLTESIDWYRDLSAQRQMATSPTDLLYFEENRALGEQIVRLSFDYAKNDAVVSGGSTLAIEPAATLDASASTLSHFIVMEKQYETKTQTVQADLEALRKKLPTARGADRKKLETAIADAQSRVDLLQSLVTGFQNVIEFAHITRGGISQSGDLGSIVDELSRTVPGIIQPGGNTTPVMAAQPAIVPSVAVPASPKQDFSILGRISDVTALRHKLRAIQRSIRLTDTLAESCENLHNPLAQFINQSLLTGDFGNIDLSANNLDVLQQQKTRLDDLKTQITDLAPAAVALDKQRFLLADYRSHAASWHNAVVDQYAAAWRTLIFHVAALLGVILVLAILARALSRFTIQHVHDANRRPLLLIGQRILLWLSILLVLIFAFASDLGSLATFLGLLTAGFAVAFQNVILAVSGYFLLVGKLGIRIGDRVQISGVTGELIDLGLLQFQIREIDDHQQPTGRVASFSNSFVFISPATGMFKVNAQSPTPESIRKLMP
jgi:hypothetical protein